MQKLLLTCILIFSVLATFAQKAKDIEIETILSKYKNKNPFKTLSIYSQQFKNEISKVFYNDGFFVVISTDKTYSPVMAFSKTSGLNSFHIDDFKNFIKSIYQNEEKKLDNQQLVKKHQQEWDKILKKDKTKDTTYGPFVDALFGQVNCKDQNGNTINVTNLNTPQNVAVGCVAISQATVLHYFAWPNQGMGSFSYNDSYGSITGNHSIIYDSSFYQMDLIKNKYHNQVSSNDERKAIGKLAYESAVSINMDFENGGSTSNVNRIPDALKNHFRFSSNYKSIDENDFWQNLDTNIISGLPVILAVKSDNGWGHSVVCSGLKKLETGARYYHLNMGWWGSGNGWYKIHEDFNAEGYNSVTSGVFDIIPNVQLFEPEFNHEYNKLTMEWDYPGFPEFDNYHLQMKLGREDWTTLADSYSDNTYTIILDGSSTYSFRVKPQGTNENILWGWSNYITFADYVSAMNNKTIQNQDLICYPNPVKDKLYVKLSYFKEEKCSVEIFNVNANKFIVNYFLYGDVLEINVKDLPSNIYFLRIGINNQFLTQTFLKI